MKVRRVLNDSASPRPRHQEAADGHRGHSHYGAGIPCPLSADGAVRHAMRGTTSGTSLLWVLTVVLGTAVLSLADGDLKCACSLRGHTDEMVNVTCSNVQNRSDDISCLRGERRAGSLHPPRYVRDGFMPLWGRSMVFFSHSGSTWQGARSSCALLGARLLLPRDPHKLSLLSQSPFYEMFTESEAFIGASDLDEEGNFVDIEGKPVDDLPWRSNEPNNAGGVEHCAVWNRAGGANDRLCGQPLQYLCEWEVRAPPPPGFALVGGAGSFVLLSDDRRPYDAAAAACAAHGAALFVPDTRDRVEALLRHVPVDSGDMLVGVTDRRVEGDFVTDAGRRLSDMEFHDWLPGQPDDGAGAATEDCVVLHSHGFLADVSCDQPLRYVCEWLP